MSDTERYFPNHKLKRDIGLAEYQVAASRLAAEDQAVNWAKNSAVIVATVVSYISFKASEYQIGLSFIGVSEPAFKVGILVIIAAFSYLSIIHISTLQKSRTLAERKIIVLRRMLGVSYGENTLVLPNWRIEGADNPFAIHLYPGVWSNKSIPVHMILVSLVASTFFLSSFVVSLLQNYLPHIPLSAGRLTTALCIFLYIMGFVIFRYNLRDIHENLWLSVAKFTAWLLNTPLVRNFEDKIYHVRLDIEEAKRIHSDFKEVTEMSVYIEDRNFHKHFGISLKALGRALWGRVQGRNLGGGSTITQQFSRSIFVSRLMPTFSRKIVEILLAIWMETVWSKTELLQGYLTTARFDNGVYGFHRACPYFFSKNPEAISKAEAFFLIERLGNIRGAFLGRRVLQLLNSAIADKVINLETCEKILSLYEAQIDSQRISCREDDIDVAQVRSLIKNPYVRQIS